MLETKLACAAALLLTAALRAESPTVVVHRNVEADAFDMAESGAPGRDCGGLKIRPKTGDTVRLAVGDAGARRDEPAVSFLLVADTTLYVLDHGARTYSELKLPLRPGTAFSNFYKSLGREAEQYLSYSLQGMPVRITDESGVTHRATVANGLAKRYDVAVTYSGQTQDPSHHGFRLEQLVQQLRHDGADWISLLPPGEGLVVALEQSRHEPEVKIRYREKLAKVEAAPADALVLAPPADYKKVTFPPGCLLGR